MPPSATTETGTPAGRLTRISLEPPSSPMRTVPLGCGNRTGPVSLEVHRSIKAALDPAGLLSPGSVFRTQPPTATLDR